MKKLFITFLMIFGFINTFSAGSTTLKPDYLAYIVGDASGNIVENKNGNDLLPLASVTKVMTMLVTFEELKKGKISLDDDVKVTWESARMGGSMIPMKSNEVFKLRDLVIAAAVHSANNATYAVATYVGGSLDNFVKMMNDRAAAMGMANELKFFTPAGLPPYMNGNKGMDVGTANGVYRMALEAEKYPEYIKLAGLKTYKLKEGTTVNGKDGTVYLRNKNHLIGSNGFYGLKTGYHEKSGYNLVAISEKNGMKGYYVVLGGRTYQIRDNKVLELDKKYRAEFQSKKVLDKKVAATKIKIPGGIQNSLSLYPENDVVVNVRPSDNLTVALNKPNEYPAPVKAGDALGTYSVILNGKEVASGKLFSNENIEEKSWFEKLLEKLDF